MKDPKSPRFFCFIPNQLPFYFFTSSLVMLGSSECTLFGWLVCSLQHVFCGGMTESHDLFIKLFTKISIVCLPNFQSQMQGPTCSLQCACLQFTTVLSWTMAGVCMCLFKTKTSKQQKFLKYIFFKIIRGFYSRWILKVRSF